MLKPRNQSLLADPPRAICPMVVASESEKLSSNTWPPARFSTPKPAWPSVTSGSAGLMIMSSSSSARKHSRQHARRGSWNTWRRGDSERLEADRGHVCLRWQPHRVVNMKLRTEFVPAAYSGHFAISVLSPRSMVVELVSDVWPELFQLVRQGVPHHLHSPSGQRASHGAICLRIVDVRDTSRDRVTADL
jgi:hypothetical protein